MRVIELVTDELAVPLVAVACALLAGGACLALSGDPVLGLAGAGVFGPTGWLAARARGADLDGWTPSDAPDAYLAGVVALNVGAGLLAYAASGEAGTAVATFLVVGGVWGAGGYTTALAVGEEG